MGRGLMHRLELHLPEGRLGLRGVCPSGWGTFYGSRSKGDEGLNQDGHRVGLGVRLKGVNEVAGRPLERGSGDLAGPARGDRSAAWLPRLAFATVEGA